MKRRLFFIVLAVLLTWGAAHLFRYLDVDAKHRSTAEDPAWQEISWDALYTSVRLVLHARPGQADTLQIAINTLFTEITQQVRTRSPLDTAIQIGRVGDTLPLPLHLCSLFRYGEEQFHTTRGRIHPGIGNLLHAYGLVHGGTPHIPAGDTLATEVQRLRTLFYRWMPNPCALILQDSGARFALGAFAKGYALDRGADLLDSAQVQHYYLEAGGDLVVKGRNPRGTPWAIGIQDPDLEKGLMGMLPLKTGGQRRAMASSGGYRKYFTDSAGTRHHHILNPATGLSISDKKSTTAFASRAIDADLWATYLFVLPMDSACAAVQSHPDIQGVILSASDSLCLTPELQNAYRNLRGADPALQAAP